MTGKLLAGEIHEGMAPIDQLQAGGAVTNTVNVAPAPGNVGLAVGEIVAPAHAPADCVTESVVPAMTGTALRAAPLLGATVKVKVPLPVWGSGVEGVIHDGKFHAVQLQLGCAVTVTAKPPPAAPNGGLLVGEMVVDGKQAPCACDRVSVAPAMVMVALCAGPLLLPTWYVSVALPVPE